MASRTFCLYDQNFENSGTGEAVFVAIFRERGDRPLEVGGFLVDLGCTGIKDAFYTQIEREELEAFKEDAFPAGCMEESPAWGRKLIEGALNYAKSLGLKPHRENKKAARVLGGVRASDCDTVFHFGGANGKPFYIQGAKHSDEAARRMVEYLSRRLGPNGFEFLVTANTALSETLEGRIEYFLDAAEAGLLKKAKNGLEELLEEHPEEAKVHFALGVTKDHGDDHEGALDYYNQAVDLDPDLAEAWINKAHAHRILGDTVNMILGLRQVCEVTTTDDEFHLRAKENLEEIANSLQEFEGLTVDAFLDAEQLFSQACGYYENQEHEQAIQLIQDNPDRIPENERTLTLLGACYRALQKWDLARGALEKALEIEPDHPTARINLLLLNAQEQGHDPSEGLAGIFQKLKDDALEEESSS